MAPRVRNGLRASEKDPQRNETRVSASSYAIFNEQRAHVAPTARITILRSYEDFLAIPRLILNSGLSHINYNFKNQKQMQSQVDERSDRSMEESEREEDIELL
jgi:hypothetical protein